MDLLQIVVGDADVLDFPLSSNGIRRGLGGESLWDCPGETAFDAAERP